MDQPSCAGDLCGLSGWVKALCCVLAITTEFIAVLISELQGCHVSSSGYGWLISRVRTKYCACDNVPSDTVLETLQISRWQFQRQCCPGAPLRRPAFDITCIYRAHCLSRAKGQSRTLHSKGQSRPLHFREARGRFVTSMGIGVNDVLLISLWAFFLPATSRNVQGCFLV